MMIKVTLGRDLEAAIGNMSVCLVQKVKLSKNELYGVWFFFYPCGGNGQGFHLYIADEIFETANINNAIIVNPIVEQQIGSDNNVRILVPQTIILPNELAHFRNFWIRRTFSLFCPVSWLPIPVNQVPFRFIWSDFSSHLRRSLNRMKKKN